jgi:hypothetical protein
VSRVVWWCREVVKARQRLAAQSPETLPETAKAQADRHGEEKAQSPAGESPKVTGDAAGGSKGPTGQGPIGVMGVEEVKSGREVQQMHWSTSTAVSDEEVRGHLERIHGEDTSRRVKGAWAHVCLAFCVCVCGSQVVIMEDGKLADGPIAPQRRR